MLLPKLFQCWCQTSCDGWRVHNLGPSQDQPSVDTEPPAVEIDPVDNTSVETEQDIHVVPQSPSFAVSDFVVADYKGKVYVGRVDSVDEDSEIKVTFMKKTVSKLVRFKWPNPIDVLWVPTSDVLMTVAEPLPLGRSQRFFTLSTEDLKKVQATKYSLG